MLAPRRPRENPVQVVWFKRDLRINDHRPLLAAATQGFVLPLYIVEPDLWRQPDASARQWDFAAESLQDLDRQLRQLGQPLVVRFGNAVDVLGHIHGQFGIAALWSHEETGNGWTFARDKAVSAWAQAHDIPWHELRQTGVVRRLVSRNGWAQAWDRQMAEATVEPPPGLPQPVGISSEPLPSAAALGLAPDGCLDRQPGGREAGLKLLHGFLYARGATYRRDMSSPLTGADSCSRLSPHLAFGTISMREAAQAAWVRSRELKGDNSAPARDWRGSVASFQGRLHWHCHFMQKLESEPRLEFEELHRACTGLRPRPGNLALMQAWAVGQTGFPFFDACMRSLIATGWLNFRMRAMVMSFASYNLWLPWQETGTILARLFTDYEPGIHWPQVQMQSGTTGINTIRMYNIVKQGRDQDPDGVFIRRWVAELATVPDQYVHEPWLWGGSVDVIGARYPERIVDLAVSAAAAKDLIYGLRGSRAFRATADAIQDKHGSRKSGIKMVGQKSKRRKKQPTDQIEMDI
jgi:deoxyribodipyrimidine photo-lyase